MVLDEPQVIAFLDHRPLFKGHVLVIPRPHVRNLMELPEDLLTPLFSCVQRLSIAVKSAMEADGIFNASNNGVSQSVDHLHVHVVPRRKKDGLRGFMWPRLKYADHAELDAVAARIRSAL